jgi:dihydroxyacid dehydratase/phosphogluconate dehydratase
LILYTVNLTLYAIHLSYVCRLKGWVDYLRQQQQQQQRQQQQQQQRQQQQQVCGVCVFVGKANSSSVSVDGCGLAFGELEGLGGLSGAAAAAAAAGPAAVAVAASVVVAAVNVAGCLAQSLSSMIRLLRLFHLSFSQHASRVYLH